MKLSKAANRSGHGPQLKKSNLLKVRTHAHSKHSEKKTSKLKGDPGNQETQSLLRLKSLPPLS